MLTGLMVLAVIAGGGLMINEGIFRTGVILICTAVSGLVAFNFFEPIAAFIDGHMGSLGVYADFFALMILFAACEIMLLTVAFNIAPQPVELHQWTDRIGAIILGGWSGWVLGSILFVAVQTLPIRRDFLGYNFRNLQDKQGLNADRYWLAFVNQAGLKYFDRDPEQAFDPRADFVIRYHNYRRVDETGATKVGSSTEEGPKRPAISGTGSARRRGT